MGLLATEDRSPRFAALAGRISPPFFWVSILFDFDVFFLTRTSACFRKRQIPKQADGECLNDTVTRKKQKTHQSHRDEGFFLRYLFCLLSLFLRTACLQGMRAFMLITAGFL